MIQLQLIRTSLSDYYTEGHILINDQKFCDTLEPSVRAQFHPAIPAGRYKIVKHQSHRFTSLRPMLEDVPGRKYILIHEGNTPTETLGCILVGIKTKTAIVEKSRDHLGMLWKRLTTWWNQGEDVYIQISQ